VSILLDAGRAMAPLVIVGAVISIAVFGGYKLGARLQDSRENRESETAVSEACALLAGGPGPHDGEPLNRAERRALAGIAKVSRRVGADAGLAIFDRNEGETL
jgi:hypothetical protein